MPDDHDMRVCAARQYLVHVLRNQSVALAACLREMEGILASMADAVKGFREIVEENNHDE